MGVFREWAAPPPNRINFCSGLSSLNSFLPKPHTGAETGETGEGGLAPSKRQVQRRRNGCEGGGTISRAERAKTIF